MSEDRFEIKTRDGETIRLDKATVVKYLTDNQAITDSEYNVFFQLCKHYGVNPFIKEAYIAKYGNQPATIVIDYKVYRKIAEDNKNYRGMRHGVVVLTKDEQIIERDGEYKLPSETLIAGWCDVYRSDREKPTHVTAMFDEFKGTKKDGELNSNWATKPCFMICKVAQAQALREAFPNAFSSNMYIPEEMDSVAKPEPKPEGNTTVTNSLEEEDGVVVEVTSAPAE